MTLAVSEPSAVPPGPQRVGERRQSNGTELFEEEEADEPPVRTLFEPTASDEEDASEEAEEEEEEEAPEVPFAVALQQLTRAHESSLATALSENRQLRSEISHLKGRIGMLMLALQRASPTPSPRGGVVELSSPAQGAPKLTAAGRPAAAAYESVPMESPRAVATAPPPPPSAAPAHGGPGASATSPSNSPSQRRPLSPRIPEVPRPAPGRPPTPPEAEPSPAGFFGDAPRPLSPRIPEVPRPALGRPPTPPEAEPSPAGSLGDAPGEAPSDAGSEGEPCGEQGAPASAEERKSRVTVLSTCESGRGEGELEDDRHTIVTVEVEFQNTAEKNWARLVGKFLNNVANKELLCLNPDWVQSTEFIRKVERSWNHIPGATDILVNPEFNPKARKTAVTVVVDHNGFLRRSIFSGSSANLWLPGQGNSVPHLGLSADGFLSRLVMDPQSPKRISFGMLGLILMVYDILVMPVELAYNLEQGIFLVMMNWLSQIFWTLDICVSFITGYYKNSELEMRLGKVVRAYMTTWFPIDIVVTVPLWVLLLIDEGSCTNCEAARASTGVKTVRFLRVLRLLRLVKFTHTLSESLKVINSPEVLCSLGIVKYMVGMVMINHVLSCVWYAVGKHGAIAEGEVGWVKSFLELDHPATTWEDSKATIYLYLTSLHWTVTQFQGTSDILPGDSLSERITAVLVVMSAFVIFSWYVSSLTNMMMRLQQLHSDRINEQVVVWGYLSNHHISGPLSVRVKKYIEWKQRVHTYREHDAQMVQLLPAEIMADLLEEVRVPVLSAHKFFAMFRGAYPKIVRRVCGVMKARTPAPDEEIFSPHDGQSHMYFVESGFLEYSYHGSFAKKSIGGNQAESHRHPSQTGWQPFTPFEQSETLSKGYWLAEQILWTNWSHVGKLVGKSDSCLLVLEGMTFTEIVKSNSAAHCSAVYYARRFVGELNRFGKTYTDFLPKTFFELLTASHDDE